MLVHVPAGNGGANARASRGRASGSAPQGGNDATGCSRSGSRPAGLRWRSTRGLDRRCPRGELTRIVRSRTTPPVDDEPVWIIPCITVRKAYRGRGIAVALIRTAVSYAGEHGAPAVEAYPRADGIRTRDDNAFIGTEPLFRRAGFQVVREPLPDRPRNWLPRVAMRMSTSHEVG